MQASKEKVRSRLQFMSWLRRTSPQLYAQAVKSANAATRGNGSSRANGLGEAQDTTTDTTESWWQKALNTVAAAGSTYLSLKNQRDALKLNIARAEQGLAPLDTASMTTPTINTQVSLPPDVVDKITRSADTGINKTLLVAGGLGLAALYMFSR